LEFRQYKVCVYQIGQSERQPPAQLAASSEDLLRLLAEQRINRGLLDVSAETDLALAHVMAVHGAPFVILYDVFDRSKAMQRPNVLAALADAAKLPGCLKVLLHDRSAYRQAIDAGVPQAKAAFPIREIVPLDRSASRRVRRLDAIVAATDNASVAALVRSARILQDEDITVGLWYVDIAPGAPATLPPDDLPSNMRLCGRITNPTASATAVGEADAVIVAGQMPSKASAQLARTFVLEAMFSGCPVISASTNPELAFVEKVGGIQIEGSGAAGETWAFHRPAYRPRGVEEEAVP
jgi:hypothetical protein